MDAVGSVAVRDSSFPSDVRFVECDRQIGGKTIEANRICPGTIEIVIGGWIVCSIVKRIARTTGHFAGAKIVDEIFLRELSCCIISAGKRVVIDADLPDRL